MSNPAGDTEPAAGADEPKNVALTETYNLLGKLLETGEYSDLDVYVSENKKHYRLHKAILSHNSGYFRRVFKSSFREAEENKVDLPEVQEGQFDLLVHWLYYGKILEPREPGSNWSVSTYSRLLGHSLYFDIPSLKSATIESIARLLRTRNPSWYYDNDIPSRQKYLIEALKTIFEVYHTEKEALSGLIATLAEKGYLKKILVEEELRPLILKDPELMMKLLELRSEVYPK